MNLDTQSVTVVCVALLGLLVFLLGANVTRHRAALGDSGNHVPTDPADRLLIAQRAHGNAAEYAPMLAVLLLLCASLTDGWWVQVLAVAGVAFRVLHAVGMLRSTTLATHGTLRDLGAAGTYLTGVVLCVTAVVTV